MGIHIPPALTPGHRLFLALATGMAGLSGGERYQIATALSSGTSAGWQALPDHLQAVLEGCARTVTDR